MTRSSSWWLACVAGVALCSGCGVRSAIQGAHGNSIEHSIQDSSQQTTQQSSDDTTQQLRGPSIVISASGVALSTTSVAVTIYMVFTESQRRADVVAATMMYLRDNAEQLKQDLALGAGPSLDDLAAAAQIRMEDRPLFARTLQLHRAELLALAREDALDEHRAVAFLERIGLLVRNDPVLRRNYEAFVARHAQEKAG